MMRSGFGVVLWLIGLAGLAAAQSGDWPQWRGTQRDGVSREEGLLKQWPSDGPRRVWLFRDAGLGYSSPAVAGERLYVMGTQGDQEMLLALDAKSGQKLWASPIGPLFTNNWGDGPRGTPTVDGEYVYALGGQGNLICARAADGHVTWQVSMEDFGGRTPSWGYCESVLVDGNRLLCTPGGGQGAILALDKRSGAKIWQSAGFTDAAQYASMISAEHGGVAQYIQLTMQHVAGVAADDGRLLWQHDFPGSTAVIPTPIYHDGHVYVTAGYGAGCLLLKLDENNRPREVYSNKNMKNHHGGVVRIGEHLYGYSDGVGWVCQHFRTGEIVWRERRALGKGCLVAADGMLYLVDEQDGQVVLIEASPEGWREHGRFTINPQTTLRKPSGRIWTHPVVAGGRLYLRDQELLFCYDVARR